MDTNPPAEHAHTHASTEYANGYRDGYAAAIDAVAAILNGNGNAHPSAIANARADYPDCAGNGAHVLHQPDGQR